MDLHYDFEVDQNSIKIINNNDNLVAFIDLINGGSLQHLKLNGITIIEQKKEKQKKKTTTKKTKTKTKKKKI